MPQKTATKTVREIVITILNNHELDEKEEEYSSVGKTSLLNGRKHGKTNTCAGYVDLQMLRAGCWLLVRPTVERWLV